MAPKRRLITDTFKVVKRAKKGEKDTKSVPETVQSEPEPSPLTQREKDLWELRQFDLDWRFGPCTGISRLQRWDRAAFHGLNPPPAIRELLLKTENDSDCTHCLWHDYPL